MIQVKAENEKKLMTIMPKVSKSGAIINDHRREFRKQEFMGTDLEECPRDLIRKVIDA